jgi:hypothetical protein
MTITRTVSRFRAAYSGAFEAYISSPSENALHAAYELGREAVAKQLSMLDLTEIHHGVVALVLVSSGGSRAETVMAAASDFLLETLSAYEMVQRGFRETQEELRNEREHADQLRRLADSSIAISSRLSIGEMLQTLTRHARRVIGVNCCLAGIVGANDDARNAAISRAPAHSHWDRFTTEPHLSELHAIASGLGGPTRMDEVGTPRDFIFRDEVDIDPGDLLIAPLKSRKQDHVGFIVLAGKVKGGFTDKDTSISIQLAQTVSAAIDNALLYEREHRIAEALQGGLLPREIPHLRGVAVAARYMPGAAGLNVGGDWYDVMSLPKDRTGVAMGDVAGRGVKAATVMGQIRTAFRAYAHDGSQPESVVRRLDRLMSTLDPDHFSTMAYLVWDPGDAAAHTVVAGHPPPLLIDHTGRARYLDEDASVPLGTLPGFPYRQVRTPVDVGSTLVMYTDGLVEQEAGLDEGLARLARAAAHGGSPDELCDRILESMLPPNAEDDVAIAVLRFLGENAMRVRDPG